jgi:DNA-binding response OmpR family regulator
MLPGSTAQVCREIRKTSRIPVVMLTARRRHGPDRRSRDRRGRLPPEATNPRERSRLNAVMRRMRDDRSSDSETFGPQASASTPRLSDRGQPIELTTTEFDILRALVSAAGRVIPRERLMELARGEEWAAYERGVDVHISHLRKKLGDDSRQPKLIKTIRGIGYLVPKA